MKTTHLCPENGKNVMRCCGRTPLELPRTDRMTPDADLATCRRDETAKAAQGAASEQDHRERRIRQLLDANNEELARRRKLEARLDERRIVLDGLLLRVQQLERREPFFALPFLLTNGFLIGLCLGGALTETLRWLFS